MDQKTLVICGGSYFSTDNEYPGCSFGEVLASENNLHLENLARSGITNFGIALQINKAIEMQPDFIIAGCTSWDRIDIPAQKQTGLIQNFLNWLEWSSQAQNISAYDKSQGLLNVMYSLATNESSTQYSQTTKETIISESINNLLWKDNKYNLDKETLAALEQYVLHLYDSNIKQQIDCWIISDAARRLVQSKIPFLLYTEELFNHDFIEDIDWLDASCKVMYYDFSYNAYNVGKPIFHLSPEDSYNFAQKWKQRLIKEKFLNG